MSTNIYKSTKFIVAASATICLSLSMDTFFFICYTVLRIILRIQSLGYGAIALYI
jgi:hypothetical protein